MVKSNTGVEDRDQWHERILRALKDLRGDDSVTVGRMRREEGVEEAAETTAF